MFVCVCLFVCLFVHALRRRLQSACRPSLALGSLGFDSCPHCPHLHRDWAHPCDICTGTGLTPATFAPGLGARFWCLPIPWRQRAAARRQPVLSSTTVGLFGFASKPCRGALHPCYVVRNAICHGAPLPLSWPCHRIVARRRDLPATAVELSAPLQRRALVPTVQFVRQTMPRLSSRGRQRACFARPPWRHMLAFARPRRHLLRSSHFSLLAVLIPDKETVAHAPNTRRLPLACSEGRQCPPLHVVCCLSSVAYRPLHVVRCMSSVAYRPLHVPRAGCLSASSCPRRRLPARSAIGWTARVPSTSAPGLGSLLPCLRARPCHICTGTRPTPPTTAPGLGSPLPHLHWDWAADCMQRGQPESEFVLLRERPRSHGFLARMRRATP